MCRSAKSYYTHQGQPQSKEEKMRYRFYKHLNTYVFINAFFLISSIGDGGVGAWKWVALIWGISLIKQYKKLKEFTDGPNHDIEDELVDDIGPEEKPTNWKDKDLV